MSTLQQLMDADPRSLLEVTKAGSPEIVTKFNRILHGTSEIRMDNNITYPLNDAGWELTVPPFVLADEQAIKEKNIDNRTGELIGNGFLFDGNVFSLSGNAQLNWVALKASLDIITFPLSISTKDSSEYSLTEANAIPFSGTAIATKQAHLDSGRALVVSVYAATNQTELDAVVDNR